MFVNFDKREVFGFYVQDYVRSRCRLSRLSDVICSRKQRGRAATVPTLTVDTQSEAEFTSKSQCFPSAGETL